MKQAILQKTFCNYGTVTHGKGGEKVIKNEAELFMHVKHCLRAGEGINDLKEIYSIKETEDKKAWIVSYWTYNEYWPEEEK